MDTSSYVNQIVESAAHSAQNSRVNAQTNNYSSLVNRSRTIEDVKKSAEDFEAVFVTQMVQHMYKGVQADPLFGGGNAEEVFKTFLFDEYGKVMAKAGGIGIASHIQEELMKTQQLSQ